jgi:hypothetical protein
MSAALTTQSRMVKEKLWKEVVCLKRMLTTPEKCKYNTLFTLGRKIRKKRVNCYCMHELKSLHYSLQCWRKPKLLPLLGYEEKHAEQISRQRHSR